MTDHYQNDVIDLTEESFTITTNTGNMGVIELLDDKDDSLDKLSDSIDDVNDRDYELPTNRKKTKKKSSVSKTTCQNQSPKKVKPKKKMTGMSIGDCPICWEELGTNPMASTICGHLYCTECLEKSLKREKLCPTCRKEIKGRSGYHPIYI